MDSSPELEKLLPVGAGIRRRPLPGMSLVFIAGTALGLHFEASATWWLFAGGLSLTTIAAIAVRCGPDHSRSTAFIYLTLALLGAASAALRTGLSSTSSKHLQHEQPTGFYIQVIGDPAVYTTHSDFSIQSVPAKILAWQDSENSVWRAGRGKLTVRQIAGGFRSQPQPRYGDRWLVHGKHYDGNLMRARGRRNIFRARQAELISTGHGYPWVARCFDWRRSAAAGLSAGITHFPERVAMIRALLLGLRHELSPQQSAMFTATGTLHVMAISGLHVGVMTGLFVFVLKCLGISRSAWFYYLAPLLVAYTLATGARPSAVRACIMALAYWAALPLRRRPDVWSALALAAIIILVYDPRQLMHPGFLFSFIVVGGLLVFFVPVYSRLTGAYRLHNAFKLPSRPGVFIRELEMLGCGAAGLATVSSIAWFMAAPLSARYFGSVSLVSFAANLVVVPLAFLTVVTGCLSLTFGAIVPFAGVIFNHANLVWTGALLRILPFFAGLPGAEIKASFPAWALPLWYGSLFLLGLRLHRNAQNAP